MPRCDLCGFVGPRTAREVNSFGPLAICGVCFLTRNMIERFEFAGPARGPMAVLKWQGFEVRCTVWPETFLALAKVGALGPKAAEEARELAEALAEGF